MQKSLALPHHDKGMISLNRDEPGDTAQKPWALTILSQLKKWVSSDPNSHLNHEQLEAWAVLTPPAAPALSTGPGRYT